MVLIV